MVCKNQIFTHPIHLSYHKDIPNVNKNFLFFKKISVLYKKLYLFFVKMSIVKVLLLCYIKDTERKVQSNEKVNL